SARYMASTVRSGPLAGLTLVRTQQRSLMLFAAPPTPMIVPFAESPLEDAGPAWASAWAIRFDFDAVTATRAARRPIATPDTTNRACFIGAPLKKEAGPAQTALRRRPSCRSSTNCAL